MSSLDVEIVVAPRERYRSGPAMLKALLSTVPHNVPVRVVLGGASRRVTAQLRRVADDRVQFIGTRRHLAPNSARRIGLDSVEARFTVFIDNDCVPQAGWLEPLVDTALRHDAWAVRPIITQRRGDRVTIHEVGGDCHIEERDGGRVLVENHRFVGMALDELPPLSISAVEMFEFHCVMFDTARLRSLGGPDPEMLSQGEHLDLSLRVHAAGGTVWIDPRAVAEYQIPTAIGVTDLPFFLGRWSPRWNTASRLAAQRRHDLDTSPSDATWRYPETHRQYAWYPLASLSRILRPFIGRDPTKTAAQRFDRLIGRHLANAVLRLDPKWRGGGLETR